MIHSVICIKIWHIHLSAESVTRNQLISIVIQNNRTKFMQSLLVLTHLARLMIMKRMRIVLQFITSCKIYAKNHSDLHAWRKIIRKFIFNSLLIILEINSFLFLPLPLQRIAEHILMQRSKFKSNFPQQIFIILVNPQYNWLLGIVVA